MFKLLISTVIGAAIAYVCHDQIVETFGDEEEKEKLRMSKNLGSLKDSVAKLHQDLQNLSLRELGKDLALKGRIELEPEAN